MQEVRTGCRCSQVACRPCGFAPAAVETRGETPVVLPSSDSWQYCGVQKIRLVEQASPLGCRWGNGVSDP